MTETHAVYLKSITSAGFRGVGPEARLDPQPSGDAAIAWWGLSGACHQHAYEIARHHAEVSQLVASVRTLP